FQQIIFRQQRHISTQSFIDIAFIVAGAHFDLALGKIGYMLSERTMFAREEWSCLNEGVHFLVSLPQRGREKIQSAVAASLWRRTSKLLELCRALLNKRRVRLL